MDNNIDNKGKFIGASGFGIISDKYGRKTAFSIACVTYIVGSILVTVSPVYVVLLMGRLCLGLASSGIFYAAFTLCKSDNKKGFGETLK